MSPFLPLLPPAEPIRIPLSSSPSSSSSSLASSPSSDSEGFPFPSSYSRSPSPISDSDLRLTINHDAFLPLNVAHEPRRDERIVVRPMRTSDMAEVKRLHALLLPTSYPASFFLHHLLQPTHLALLAVPASSPNTIVGFTTGHIISSPPSSPPQVHLTTLALLPSHRRLHLGTLLIRTLLTKLGGPAGRLRLDVQASNTAARRFYTSLGLTEAERDARMYRGVRAGGQEGLRLVGTIAAA